MRVWRKTTFRFSVSRTRFTRNIAMTKHTNHESSTNAAAAGAAKAVLAAADIPTQESITGPVAATISPEQVGSILAQNPDWGAPVLTFVPWADSLGGPLSEDSGDLSAEELANCSNEGHVANAFEQDQVVIGLGAVGELRYPGYQQESETTQVSDDDFLRRMRENEGADMRDLI